MGKSRTTSQLGRATSHTRSIIQYLWPHVWLDSSLCLISNVIYETFLQKRLVFDFSVKKSSSPHEQPKSVQVGRQKQLPATSSKQGIAVFNTCSQGFQKTLARFADSVSEHCREFTLSRASKNGQEINGDHHCKSVTDSRVLIDIRNTLCQSAQWPMNGGFFLSQVAGFSEPPLTIDRGVRAIVKPPAILMGLFLTGSTPLYRVIGIACQPAHSLITCSTNEKDTQSPY